MSRIPAGAARRIDRLARRAHRFHRFAHHPLCPAYRDEVLQVGRCFLCKGCTLAGTGALAGMAAALAVPRLPLMLLAGMALVGMILGLRIWARPRRYGKGLTRFLPLLAAGFMVVQGLRHGTSLGFSLALGVGLAVAGGVVLYRRRGPWRAPCTACPEQAQRPCPGFRRQFRRERAFRRIAAGLLH